MFLFVFLFLSILVGSKGTSGSLLVPGCLSWLLPFSPSPHLPLSFLRLFSACVGMTILRLRFGVEIGGLTLTLNFV